MLLESQKHENNTQYTTVHLFTTGNLKASIVIAPNAAAPTVTGPPSRPHHRRSSPPQALAIATPHRRGPHYRGLTVAAPQVAAFPRRSPSATPESQPLRRSPLAMPCEAPVKMLKSGFRFLLIRLNEREIQIWF